MRSTLWATLRCAALVMLLTLNSTRSLGATVAAQQPAAGWTEVRSLGKMWQWHSLLGISPDGTKLLLGGRSTVLAVYDLNAGKVSQVVRTRETVQDAAYSPDGEFVAIAEWRDGVTLRSAATMKVLEKINGSAGLGAAQIRFSSDSRRLIGYSWSSSDKQFWSYDLHAKQEIGWPAGKNADTPKRYMREGLRGWGQHLFSVERDYDGAKGYTTGYRAWVTDSRTGKVGDKIELGGKDYFQFDIDPDGARAIIMQPGDDPRVIDLKTGKTIVALEGHQRWCTCAAFSPDGKTIATASGTTYDGHARIYTTKFGPPAAPTEIMLRDAATGRVIATFQDAQTVHDYARIGFSPKGSYVWTQSYNNELRLWGRLPAIPINADPLPNYDSDFQVLRPVRSDVSAAPTGIGAPSAPSEFLVPVADRIGALIQALAASKRSNEAKVDAVFLAVLGRLPTAAEQGLALAPHHGRAIDKAGLTKLRDVLTSLPEFRQHVTELQKKLFSTPSQSQE